MIVCLKRWWECLALIGVLHLMLPSVGFSSAKPNIIVIFTDDHGYADIQSQGYVSDLKTPNIDSLANGGVRVTDGYVTAPQCVPSRAGILSGQYQNRFGLELNPDLRRKPEVTQGFTAVKTIPERLSKKV